MLGLEPLIIQPIAQFYITDLSQLISESSCKDEKSLSLDIQPVTCPIELYRSQRNFDTVLKA
jgi:hypothetical protein